MRKQGLERVLNLPEATRQHMMDQGFAPRTFATPAAFLHLPGPSLQNQNIGNRKCSKTQEKLGCGKHLIRSLGSSMLNPQPRLLPGKPLLTHRSFFPFPSPRQAFLLEWPRKIKADHFAYWGPLMNCSYWGSNKLPMTLFCLHSTTTKRHRVTAALASDTCQGHTGVLLLGFTQARSTPGHACCSSNRFQSSAG